MSRRILVLALVALLTVLGASLPTPVVAQSPAPAEAKNVAELPPVDVKEIRLDNGLRIFVLERPSSPRSRKPRSRTSSGWPRSTSRPRT